MSIAGPEMAIMMMAQIRGSLHHKPGIVMKVRTLLKTLLAAATRPVMIRPMAARVPVSIRLFLGNRARDNRRGGGIHARGGFVHHRLLAGGSEFFDLFIDHATQPLVGRPEGLADADGVFHRLDDGGVPIPPAMSLKHPVAAHAQLVGIASVKAAAMIILSLAPWRVTSQ